jgi:zinc protease
MLLDRTQQPIIKNATEFNFQLAGITQTTLQNDIPFYYLNAGVQEVVSLEFVFDAGTWQQPKAGVAQGVMALLKNGTSTKNATQINEQIEYYGAQIKCGVGNDMATVTISCLSKHLHQLLPLVLELFLDSIYPESELEIYKQSTLQRMQVSLKKSDFVANRKIDEYLFGFDHPYGAYNNVEDITALQSTDLQHFLQSYFSYNRCKIFLAGRFSENIIADIQNIFGQSKWNESKDIAEKNYAITPAEQKKYRITNDENGVQGSIRMSMPFVQKSHPDFAPMIITNTLFGGYFGSRLMSNIREEKGYTYGIYSYLYNNRHAGAIGISTEAGKDVCEAAVVEIYKEIKLLQTKLVDEEELQLVKNYILGGIIGDLDGPFQIMARWKNLILFGFDKNRFDSNIQIYKTITAKQIQGLMQQYWKPENFYELIVI